MTPALEEALRMLRLADADLAAFTVLNVLLNPYAVTLRYDDLEVLTLPVNEAGELARLTREWAGRVVDASQSS